MVEEAYLGDYRSHALASVRPEERFDRFTSLVDRYFCPMDCSPLRGDASGFRAKIETTTLGQTGLARVSSTPVSVSRSRADISRISEAPYLIKFQLRGESEWSQRGRRVRLSPGDFVIASTAEPYRLTLTGSYQMPVVAVSSATMRHLTPDPEQFLGVKMSGQDAACGLLSGFVAQVVARMSDLPPPMAERIETNLLDLLGGVLASHARPGRPTIGSRLEMLSRARGLIRDNLRNRRLGPAMLAEHLGVSTRYVHKLFSGEEQTLSGYIRSLRLESCRQSLADPSCDGMSITDIAHYWGFCDLPHMSRCFRSTFGATPRAFRADAQRQRSLSDQS